MSKDPLDLFLSRVNGQERARKQHMQHTETVAETKSKTLVPVRKLLKQIQDFGLRVHSWEGGERGQPRSVQRFEVFENDSSPSFLPGSSLFFNHPAAVEIAIPNTWDKSHPGAIVICCSSHHPDADLLRGPFQTVDEACVALAEFLARSTISMDMHPGKPDPG